MEKIFKYIADHKLTLEQTPQTPRDKSTGATSPAKSNAPTQEGAPSPQPAAKNSENVVAQSAQKAGATPGESR
jgi:hypothetical protein